MVIEEVLARLRATLGVSAHGLDSATAWSSSCNLVAAALAALLLGRVLESPLSINHDCAVLLSGAAAILEGKLPYVDFYELNPPLIFYIYLVPAFVAKTLSAPLPLVFSLFVYGLCFGSTWALRRLLTGAALIPAAAVSQILAAWVFCAVWVQLMGDFGQREHIFFLVYVPMLVLRWLRWEGRTVTTSSAVLLGAVAGLGAAIKPHFLLTAALPEACWMLRRRRIQPLLAPEIVAFVAVVAGYAAHFALLPAAMRSALFGRWIPIVMHGYGAYDGNLAKMVSVSVLGVILMSIVPFLLAPAQGTPSWRLARTFAVMTAGATVVFFVQHKGWWYHFIPAAGGALMLASLLFSEVRWSSPGDAPRGAGALRLSPAVPVLCAGALGVLSLRDVALGASLLRRGVAVEAPTPYQAVVLAWSKPGDPVLCFSVDVPPCQPTLLVLGRRAGSRYYGNHFIVPFFYVGEKAPPGTPFPYHAPDSMPPGEAEYLREMREDIERLRPPLVLVSSGPSRWPRFASFDFHEYLTRTGFIAGAMRGYRRLYDADHDAVYVRE